MNWGRGGLRRRSDHRWIARGPPACDRAHRPPPRCAQSGRPPRTLPCTSSAPGQVEASPSPGRTSSLAPTGASNAGVEDFIIARKPCKQRARNEKPRAAAACPAGAGRRVRRQSPNAPGCRPRAKLIYFGVWCCAHRRVRQRAVHNGTSGGHRALAGGNDDRDSGDSHATLAFVGVDAIVMAFRRRHAAAPALLRSLRCSNRGRRRGSSSTPGTARCVSRPTAP